MREKAIIAFLENNKEQAKYYLQRMRESQALALNPSVIHIWAELERESYKKGKIQSVYKIKNLEVADNHYGTIEHIKYCKNERYLAIMSQDFTVSFWEVGTWIFVKKLHAYHEAHAKFYLKELNLDEIIGEFDVSVIAFNDGCNLLVAGLYNGMI